MLALRSAPPVSCASAPRFSSAFFFVHVFVSLRFSRLSSPRCFLFRFPFSQIFSPHSAQHSQLSGACALHSTFHYRHLYSCQDSIFCCCHDTIHCSKVAAAATSGNRQHLPLLYTLFFCFYAPAAAAVLLSYSYRPCLFLPIALLPFPRPDPLLSSLASSTTSYFTTQRRKCCFRACGSS